MNKTQEAYYLNKISELENDIKALKRHQIIAQMQNILGSEESL